ncbi:MAG: 1,2-diacylglycerol 3-alpha-glucosyltransferase [Clostridia bacterium]|nr:1,2-diacylglycerol 3-alpha-glucosyltransferase [Clostridia bacterium]
MKIAIFTDSYLPYHSGVVRSIITFSRELRALGHKVYIFAPAYTTKQAPEEGVFRFISIKAPTYKEFALAIPLSSSVLRTLKNLQIEIIHVHSPFLLGRMGAWAARRLGLPLVFTYHTLYEYYVHYFPLAPNLLRRLVRRFTISFCNRCDLVIAPTRSIAGYLNNHGVKTRVDIIPTGIEIHSFQGDKLWLRQQFGIRPEEKILLYVGRLGKEKNLEFLLQAFQRIYSQNSLARLILVGGGPLKNFLEAEAVRLGINRALIFPGSFPWEMMPNIYAGADVFVFASVTETQGLVIAEAKAAGLPVVAVKAFGVADMVEDGEDGFLTPLDINSFVERVMVLLNKETLRQEMSRKAYLNAQKLAAPLVAAKLAAAYYELL